MAGFRIKKDCPCDNPIGVVIYGKERFFPCGKCDLCVARMELFFSQFINGEDDEEDS